MAFCGDAINEIKQEDIDDNNGYEQLSLTLGQKLCKSGWKKVVSILIPLHHLTYIKLRSIERHVGLSWSPLT